LSLLPNGSGSGRRRDPIGSASSQSWPEGQLVEDVRLAESTDSEFLVFDDDVAFSSPGAAASVILARDSNGRME
jgi:hypothetical protein